jgi:pseudouridine synthase
MTKRMPEKIRRGKISPVHNMTRAIKFYKPFEVMCQFTDREDRHTLKEFISESGVYPAGRLDYRSEGLLILTDDGRLIRRLTDPQFEHPKTYLVQVEGVISNEAAEVLQERLVVPGLQTRIVKASIIQEPALPPRPTPVRAYHPTSWLKLVLYEGKKHLVRRLTAAVGYPTLRLVRYAIGEITIQDLAPGEWRHLNRQELGPLRND